MNMKIIDLEKLVMDMQGVDYDDLLNLAKAAYNQALVDVEELATYNEEEFLDEEGHYKRVIVADEIRELFQP
jgi:hypothetical protein